MSIILFLSPLLLHEEGTSKYSSYALLILINVTVTIACLACPRTVYNNFGNDALPLFRSLHAATWDSDLKTWHYVTIHTIFKTHIHDKAFVNM